MKKKRLEFAKKHIAWSIEELKKVLFSDESTFQQFTIRKNYIRRRVGERFNEKYTIFTMKHPQTQMIWGTMSANDMAGIYFLKPGTTINGAKYAKLLRDKLPTHMEIHQSFIFMHDVHLVIGRKLSSSF